MSIAADKSAAILVLNCIIFNIILHSLFRILILALLIQLLCLCMN